ncbi:cytochrome P450 [Colletotrichum graminicola]|uniref:Cytochrome P450 n=1 Tax=Colletotrichum graminicola (strain M1.001 / M2 / FGSC 10212) TaxID=645133 RepID=E3QVQ6_COLGM|nr:cytochrome P450 [Colletotrichum graminicola M1.001]EFQ34944.1 cytochrome P450 [Colletotrichum graminicola M1.001]WDK18220.1 cytochrome P450 [Colletotrichum graminicola]
MEIQFGESRLPGFVLLPLATVSLGVAGLLLWMLYNVTLHPLSKYPGPKLWAATRIPYALMVFRGDEPKTILALHKRYNADVVRVSPNELSFQHPGAWKDIMGHRSGGSEENEKDPDRLNPDNINIITAGRHDHARYRRALSHGFSAKSMQEQQPLIKDYVNLLIERLRGLAGKGPIDMVAWYNFTTFDVIGDLSFGESFGCLANSEYHPWIRSVFQNVKLVTLQNLARSFRALEPLFTMVLSKSLVEKGTAHYAFVRAKVDQRIALGTPRPDFAESMLRKGSEVSPMTKDEIYKTTGILIIAGSETTATALSGATYNLATHPKVFARLCEEVRSSFASEDEIDLLSTAKLSYLHAVIEETLRVYPPIPASLTRRTPRGGANILGQWVPGDTSVGIVQWALYHNEKYFSRPFEFHPERWLGDPAFASDSLDAFKPFHIGPRNCLGMNLAYAEMRMILARIVWTFDLRLDEGSRGWLEDQSCYTVWTKPPLMVHLTPRQL